MPRAARFMECGQSVGSARPDRRRHSGFRRPRRFDLARLDRHRHRLRFAADRCRGGRLRVLVLVGVGALRRQGVEHHSGLYDIDGDGKPEVVRVSGAEPRRLSARRRRVARKARSGAPGAGGKRLRRQDDHRLSLGEGRRDHAAPGAVPGDRRHVGRDDRDRRVSGASLSATRYAYGGAELMFDSVLDAFTLPGVPPLRGAALGDDGRRAGLRGGPPSPTRTALPRSRRRPRTSASAATSAPVACRM